MRGNRVSIKKHLNIIERIIENELELLLDGVHDEILQIFMGYLDEVNTKVTYLIQNQIKEYNEIKKVRECIENVSKFIIDDGMELISRCTFNRIKKSIKEGYIHKKRCDALLILKMICKTSGNKNVINLEHTKFNNKIDDKIVKYVAMIRHDAFKVIADEILYYGDQFNQYVMEIKKYIEDNDVEVKKSYEKRETLKILDCRDMDKYLKEIGCEPVRQRGSHKMYRMKGKTIPVPQHSKGLGKGLSYKIQKQAREIS